MSDSDFDYTAHPYGVRVIGPFVGEHRLTVRDYRVPYITAYPLQGGHVRLVLDERLSIEGTDDEIRKWVSFLADAMAVAAGYSSHGEHSGLINPFGTRLLGVSVERTDQTP